MEQTAQHVADRFDTYVNIYQVLSPNTGEWGTLRNIYETDEFETEGDPGPHIVIETEADSWTSPADGELNLKL